MNPQDRFFETTRGKIVTALRGRHGASAYELAQEFGLSPNAIRQQLVILERDGLVSGHAVRRGKTKPTQEFALTPDAERFFLARISKKSSREIYPRPTSTIVPTSARTMPCKNLSARMVNVSIFPASCQEAERIVQR